MRSQLGVIFTDQGGLSPPPFSGAYAPIVFDNIIPFGNVHNTDCNTGTASHCHRYPTIKVTRRSDTNSENQPKFTKLGRISEVTFDTDHYQHHSIIVDIISYHWEVYTLFGDWSSITPDYQLRELYSYQYRNQFNSLELLAALRASEIFADRFSRRS